MNNSRFAFNVITRALLLFIAINLAWVGLNPLPAVGRVSAYNTLLPGRPRLPYGENPSRAYNLNLFQLDALFAAHELSGSPKPADEYRVLLIGDSSVWGFLLQPQDTLAAKINAGYYATSDGKKVRAYNLGYPIMSLTKDLLILDLAAQRFQPDLIVWLVTLESFPADKQLFHPLLQHNPDAVRRLITTYNLRLDPNDSNFINPAVWDKTLVGQRRDLADVLRLQLYGLMWAATGIDQDYQPYDPPARDFKVDDTAFHERQPPHLTENDLAFDALAAGVKAAGNTPVLIVNEPMFISDGQNSDVRYNFFYPRWAYDDYHQLLAEKAQNNGWHYLDLWNLVPNAEFTNSAVHLTPRGSQQLAEKVYAAILGLTKGQE